MTRRNSETRRTQMILDALSRPTTTLPAGVHLSSAEQTTFDNLVNEFSREELTDHKLELVASLAKTLCLLHAQQELLAREGSVLIAPSGKAMPNPRHNAVNSAQASVVKLRHTLGMTGRADRVAHKRALSKELETIPQFALDNPMFAKPWDSRPGPKIKINNAN